MVRGGKDTFPDIGETMQLLLGLEKINASLSRDRADTGIALGFDHFQNGVAVRVHTNRSGNF